MGFESKELKVTGKNSLYVTVKIAVISLDETIIKGYYTTTKRLNTGNVGKVTSETISKQPVNNVLQSLQGRVAGLQIVQNTGVPGGNFSVQIRGQNSIFNGNSPLYIVDDVPVTSASINSKIVGAAITRGGNPLNNLNPSDVESIEILKDADATAIYGSRGANGVIIITTKKGKGEKTKVDVNVYKGIGRVSRMMDLLNTQQYLEMRHEAFNNDGVSPDPSVDYDILSWDTTRYTNWQKMLIGNTAHFTDIQSTLTSGGKNTQFLLGAGLHRESSVFPNDFADKKVSAHFSATSTSNNKKFKAIFSSNYIVDNSNLPLVDPTRSAFSLAPNAPQGFTATGKLNWENGTFNDNPFQYLLRPYKSKTNNLISNVLLSYELLKGIKISGNFGYTKMQINESSLSPLSSYSPTYGLTSGSSNFATNSIETWVAEPKIELNKSLKWGNINVLVGSTFQENYNNGQTISATGFANDGLLQNIAAASSVQVQNVTDVRYRYEAIFGRISYDWENKYIVNLTGRRDGSSRFGSGNQFANFGAIGGAWIFSKEDFIHNALPILSFGKLRGSYGVTGNDQIGDFQYLDTWSPTFYPYQGISGLQTNRLANPDYQWEVSKKLECGLELGLFNDRLFVSSNFYLNRSSNQLIRLAIPSITGFSTIIANSSATVRNSGFEFEFTSYNFRRKSFTWQTTFNVTVPGNKLIAYPNFAGSPYANIYEIGKSLGIVKAFQSVGVDPQTGLYTFASSDPNNPMYPDDLKASNKVTQSFYGGLQNSFSFKNWQLDVFVNFVKQTGRNYIYYNFIEPGMLGNQPSLVMNRWRKPGDQTDIQRFGQDYGDSYNAYINSATMSDRYISDASFLRLKNLSLSYSVNKAWLNKFKLQTLRLYFQGQNLFTITNYLGMDPENQNVTALPPLKVFTTGIQVTF